MDQKFDERWSEAASHGWKIMMDNNHTWRVYPPETFACRQWTCTDTTVRFKHRTIYVPHYFWNDNVLKNGDDADEKQRALYAVQHIKLHNPF